MTVVSEDEDEEEELDAELELDDDGDCRSLLLNKFTRLTYPLRWAVRFTVNKS
jgi:hypothetical protein